MISSKKKSNNRRRRQKAGRPATGKDPLISFRIPQDVINEIEGWAAIRALSRSGAIRQLIDVALSASRSP
jgi:hypothetical protein